MKKTKFIIFIFIIALSLTLTGCFNSDVEETVWDTYEGSNFVISYPGEGWHVISETEQILIGDAEIKSNMKQGIMYTNMQSVKDINNFSWEDYKSGLSELYSGGEYSDITIDGYPAYKIHIIEDAIIDNETFEATTDYYFIYDDNNEMVNMLTYLGIADNYNSELSQKIVDKFKLN